MLLKLGMQRWVLEVYKAYTSADSVLTLTYFTARPNLDVYAFVPCFAYEVCPNPLI